MVAVKEIIDKTQICIMNILLLEFVVKIKIINFFMNFFLKMKDIKGYYVQNVSKIGDKLDIIIVLIVINHCII
jgi:hypothetical protein